MKDHSNGKKWLVLLLFGSLVSAAPEQGFIRIVNAVGYGEGALKVTVNGEPLSKDGYAPGDVTGRILLPAGKHQLRFERAGLAVGNARVSIESGQSLIVIPYVEAIVGWQGTGPQYRLRVFRMASEDVGERKCVTMLSVAGDELLPLRIRDLDRGWIAQSLPRLEVKQIEVTQLRGYLPMLLGRRRMASIPLGSAGNHIVVFYDSGDGKVVSLEFKDHQSSILNAQSQFSIPPLRIDVRGPLMPIFPAVEAKKDCGKGGDCPSVICMKGVSAHDPYENNSTSHPCLGGCGHSLVESRTDSGEPPSEWLVHWCSSLYLQRVLCL